MESPKASRRDARIDEAGHVVLRRVPVLAVHHDALLLQPGVELVAHRRRDDEIRPDLGLLLEGKVVQRDVGVLPLGAEGLGDLLFDAGQRVVRENDVGRDGAAAEDDTTGVGLVARPRPAR